MAILVLTFLLAPFAAAADEVELNNGEVLIGEVFLVTDEVVLLDHPEFGIMEIPREMVFRILTDQTITSEELDELDEPDEELEEESEESEEEDKEPEGPGAVKVRLDLGFFGTGGNVDSSNLRAAGSAVGKTDNRTVSLIAVYNYGSFGSVITRNDYYIITIDEFRLYLPRWWVFLVGRYDWNRFEPWEARLEAIAGLKYRLIDEDVLVWALKGGGGFVREYGKESDRIIESEALAGTELTWKPSGALALGLNSIYYHDLSEPGEYRVVTDLLLSVLLVGDKGASFGLGFGMEDEYVSDTPPGFDHNDFKYFGSAFVSF